MKKIQLISLLAIALFLSACESSSTKTEKDAIQEVSVDFPEILKKGITAHGGLERWQSMKALAFNLQQGDIEEQHKTSLSNRKALIERDSVQVGFDGDQVWVTPNKAAFGKGSARFYHNLIFYFYSIPFVLADPGIIYEEVPVREIEGVSYEGVKISYHDGIGDAPTDYYIAYFHPETHELYLLLYTVTYFNGSPNEKYKALVYETWQEINGFKLPLKMTSYKFENDTLGAKRKERLFTQVDISEKPFDDQIFAIPNGAEIDSLIQH